MSRTPAPTPLPQLEHELIAAARRLDAAQAPARRRRWLHGWSLLSLVVVTAGASVAVARVAEFGPFAYMSSGGLARENPKLAPTSTITLEAPGSPPAWQARAYLNGVGQLCMTGGPRDPRTEPDASPAVRRRPNAPQNGVLCASSDEVAQLLVDPDRPGASFGHVSELDGALDGHSCRVNRQTGRCVPIETDPPTKLLVYVVRDAEAPRPVVRWGATGTPIAMRASTQRLRMPVDRSPDGLSPDERRIVERFPAELHLVLWAAEVSIPKGERYPQLVDAAGFIPHGVDDATIELLGQDAIVRLIKTGERRGWTYARGITREAPPANRVNAAQRRWIAAFGRPRAAADEVPQRLRTERAAFMRFGYPVSRKLEVVGDGLGDVWIAPGRMGDDMPVRSQDDQICLLGAGVLSQCKFGQRRWKRPFVEAVSCTQPGGSWPKPLSGGRTLVWALTPPGATGVELHGPAGRIERLPAGELLAVRRPVDARITAIVWTTRSGSRTRVRVPWPQRAPRCERGAPGEQILRKDNAGSYEMSTARPPGTP